MRVKGCEHKFAVLKSYYSIHGKALGTAKWCPNCQGWVDRMEEGK